MKHSGAARLVEKGTPASMAGMRQPTNLSPFRAQDPVAIAVERHVRDMEQSDRKLSVTEEDGRIALAFGRIFVRGETYDIALVRLAGALLDAEPLGGPFITRLRGSVHAINQSDHSSAN